MRNNSQRPGCMRRLPASHSCQPRRVQWMSAAAAVCESPAASRAARTSAGAGFAEGPFGPLFGWLGIQVPPRKDDGHLVKVILGGCLQAADLADISVVFFEVCNFCRVRPSATLFPCALVSGSATAFHTESMGCLAAQFGKAGIHAVAKRHKLLAGGDSHFVLQPLDPRRGGQKHSVHGLNYTRNACNCKNYLQQFSMRRLSPHNASLSGLPRTED